MNKYTIKAMVDSIHVTAKFNDFSKFDKVTKVIADLGTPVDPTQAGTPPEPAIYLDAAGKKFDEYSILAFKMDTGELYIIRIHSMDWNKNTNQWKLEVQRLSGPDDECGNYVTLSGEGSKPAPQLFKLETTFQEYMDLI